MSLVRNAHAKNSYNVMCVCINENQDLYGRSSILFLIPRHNNEVAQPSVQSRDRGTPSLHSHIIVHNTFMS